MNFSAFLSGILGGAVAKAIHWIVTRPLNPGAKASAKIDKALGGAPIVEAGLGALEAEGNAAAAPIVDKAAGQVVQAVPIDPVSPAPK